MQSIYASSVFYLLFRFLQTKERVLLFEIIYADINV